MLTIENIYNDRSLERHSEGLFVNNQQIIALTPIKDDNEFPRYYMMFSGYIINKQPIFIEKLIVHKHKKIKIPMIPFRNDEKWS